MILLVALLDAAFAAGSTYEDPRVARWSQLYREGKRTELVAEVEADLRTPDAHPFASWIWAEVMDDGDGSAADALKSVDGALARALGSTPAVVHLYNEDQYGAILERWPTPGAASEPAVVVLAAWAADNEGEDVASARWMLEAAKGPARFLGLWSLSHEIGLNDASRDAVIREIRRLPAEDQAFVLAAGAPGAENADQLALVDRWIAANGRDAYALRYRAHRMESAGRWSDAAAGFREARDAWPFLSRDDDVEMLVRLGRSDDAARVAQELALMWEPAPDEREASAARYLARAWRNAGDRGTARTLLVEGLRKWPGDVPMMAELAYLEQDSGRWTEAAEAWEKVASPSDGQRAARIRALVNAGRGEEARAWCDPATVPAVNGILDACIDAWTADGSSALAFTSRAMQLRPRSLDVRIPHAQALIDAGRRGDAKKVVDAVLAEVPYHRAAVLQVTSLLPPDKADAWLKAWCEGHPALQTVWTVRLDRLDRNDHEARIALTKAALSSNPHEAWAWTALDTALSLADRDAERFANLEAWAADLPEQGPGARLQHYFVEMWALDYHLTRGDVEATKLRAAVEAYAAEGGDPAWVAYYRARVHEADGRADLAVGELMEAAALLPDWEKPRVRLFQSSEIHAAGGGMAATRVMWRWAARDPFDGVRLHSLAHFHILWSGNPVVGLEALDRIAVVDPDQQDEWLRATAYGHLGAPVQSFERLYGRATTISSSLRYVGWYENARRKAAESTGDVRVELTPPDTSDGGLHLTGRATLRYPDGRELVRVDDPITGKPLEVRMGDASVVAEYDDRANLTAIRSASGKEIALEYDEADRILRLKKPSRTVSFEYNAHSKPTRMLIEEAGTTEEIRVTYEEDGETIRTVDSTSGRTAAMAMTEVFSELLELVEALGYRSIDSFGPFAPQDAELDELRQSLDDAWYGEHATAGGLADASLALGRYLFDHSNNDPRRTDEAEQVVFTAWSAVSDPNVPVKQRAAGVAAVEAWHGIARKAHPDGLDRDQYGAWTQMMAWLDETGAARGRVAKEARAARDRIEAAPLKLRPAERWMERSALTNPGYWQTWRHRDVLPAKAPDTALQSVLVRGNGDVVVGSAKGLAVQSRGHFTVWAHDDGRGAWTRAATPAASSDVRALAETPDGALWVGTANGLFRIESGPDGASRAWRTAEDGLPSPGVEYLAVFDGKLLVGTRSGMRVMSPDGTLVTPAGLGDVPIRGFAVHPTAGTVPEAPYAYDGWAPEPFPARPALVLTPAGVWSLGTDGATARLNDVAADSAAWSPDDDLVLYTQGTRVDAWRWQDGLSGDITLLGKDQVMFSKAIHGVEPFELFPGQWAVAVLTDQGLSVWWNQHFEHTTLELRLVDGRPAVTDLAYRDGRTWLLTRDGLLAHEAGQAQRLWMGAVTDLVSVGGTTWVASGDALGVVMPDSQEVLPLQWMDVQHLAAGPEGTIYAHDGRQILRVPAGGAQIEVLFDATPHLPTGVDAPEYATVQDLTVTRDGALWVVCGSSVFRWKDGAAQEFNWYTDPERFPLRSDMPFRVVETQGHEVWVIGSRESHRSHRGISMDGGVVAYDGKAFRRLRLSEETAGWFVSSYTAVDGDTAIVGTTAGFVRHQGGWQTYAGDLSDASYLALRERVPSLFLGTPGARLDDVWLFGTAGGVVAWSDGRWFYPERLNRLLVRDEILGSYGGRAVHAVAVDDAGRVFVGNDSGLLVYDAGGASAASFLIWNQFMDAPFLDAELAKLQAEADAFRAAVPEDSPIGKVLAAIEGTRDELQTLEVALDPSVLGMLAASGPDEPRPDGNGALSPDRTAELKAALEARRREERELLGRIETEYPALYQMLDAKPFDLAALRGRLGPDQLVVQYLPTPGALYIHLVDKDEARVVTVTGVTKDEIATRARRVALHLGAEAARGVKVTPTGTGVYDPIDDLEWLYQALYAPIESEIAARKQMFVVPVAEITYVPFAALVHSRTPTVKYAVEHFRDTSVGVVPSLYLFDLAVGTTQADGKGALVVGDPDGTLPGARAEAASVQAALDGATLLTGAAATRSAVVGGMDGRRYVHLGTHGILAPDDPYHSYLVLADKQRLDMVDVLSLPLDGAGLVVLSACDTGVGRTGLEYATLARSFAQAGAPSVVATLWSVPDAPSQRLVEAFYGNLSRGEDHFLALAHAQRQMLAEESARKNPSEWAGYVVFGRP